MVSSLGAVAKAFWSGSRRGVKMRKKGKVGLLGY